MKLTFTGDVSFTGNFKDKVLSNERHGIICKDLKTRLKSGLLICNLEGPATDSESVLRKDVSVISPPESVRFLHEIGVDVFNLANNHTFDALEKGYNDTVKLAKEFGIRYMGAGKNLQEASKILYFEKDGVKVALLAVSQKVGMVATHDQPGTFCYMNEQLVKEKIGEAKKNADHVVVSYHGGAEFNFIPTPTQRKRARSFIEWGADCVIGHHPHVAQGMETYRGKLIFYSLGNFIFDLDYHRSKKNFDLAYCVQLTMSKKEISYELIGVKTDFAKARICVYQKINDLIRNISEPLQDDKKYETSFKKEAFRTICLNPARSQKLGVASYAVLPLLAARKLYLSRIGFDRELLKGALEYLNLGFVYNFFPGEEVFKIK